MTLYPRNKNQGDDSVIPSIAANLYTSMPPEQRFKAAAQLAKAETTKNVPVYLQVERAQNTQSQMPYSIVA